MILNSPESSLRHSLCASGTRTVQRCICLIYRGRLGHFCFDDGKVRYRNDSVTRSVLTGTVRMFSIPEPDVQRFESDLWRGVSGRIRKLLLRTVE